MKVDFTLPYRKVDLLVFQHADFALVTHDNVLLNGLFYKVLINNFLLAILLDFAQDRPRELVKIQFEDLLVEYFEGRARQIRLASILQIIPVEIIEQLLQSKDEECETLPLLAILLEELSVVANFLFYGSFKHILDEAFDAVLEYFIKLCRLILLVTQSQNCCVSLNEALRILHFLASAQMLKKLREIVVDKLYSLIK